MAINKYSAVVAAALALWTGSAWAARDAATPSECQAFASKPAISTAIAKASHSDDWRSQVALADAWSDSGCYNEAVNVLQTAASAHPEVAELQTRLRVAKSLVGEEHFFDDLDRADRQAQAKRDAFRCNSLSDLDACNQAARLSPEDPLAITAYGDALLRAKRPSDALQQYRRAEKVATNKQAVIDKIHQAEAELAAAPADAPTAPVTAANRERPGTRVAHNQVKAAPRRYSNVMPNGQSH